MIEDNHQHRHNVIAHLDDDEEKFYDRITLEYQCACLLRLGCPPEGFVEWAAESLNNNNVTIVTIKGLINAKFLCGLKQGAADSCPLASAVSVAKGDTWSIDPPYPTHVQNAAYYLKDHDPLLDRLNNLLYALCYCDDGSRYTAATTVEQAVANCQHYINRAGDLSLVVKLGRKSKKCCVYIHNAPQGTTLPRFKSFAWSFLTQSPLETTIAIQIHTEATAGTPNTALPYNKHFGTMLNILGDTAPTDVQRHLRLRSQKALWNGQQRALTTTTSPLSPSKA